MLKLYAFTQKIKGFAELGGLIVDTIKYFHDTGVARGVFGTVDKAITE